MSQSDFAQVLREICDPNAEPARRTVLLGAVDNAASLIERAIAFGYSDERVASLALEELRKIFAARHAHSAVSP